MVYTENGKRFDNIFFGETVHKFFKAMNADVSCVSLHTTRKDAHATIQELGNVALMPSPKSWVPPMFNGYAGVPGIVSLKGTVLFKAIAHASEQKQCEIVACAFAALASMHEAGVYHLDASAANVIVTGHFANLSRATPEATFESETGVLHDVYLIDFATAIVPGASVEQQALFDSDVKNTFDRFGYGVWTDYLPDGPCNGPGSDVHCLAVSLMTLLRDSKETNCKLMRRLKKIIPYRLKAVQEAGTDRLFRRYLLDHTAAVPSAREACDILLCE